MFERCNNFSVETIVFFLEFLLQHVNDADDMDARKNVVMDTALSEEVSGIPEGNNEYVDGDESESHGEDASHAENVDEDDEELAHPGEVSIGKKLWTFFTT